MIGQTFNYLTVLAVADKPYYYTCQCTCGVIKTIRKDDLLKGSTKSCGCKRTELQRASQFLPVNESFFLESSPDRDYFLGLFLTDGYISKNKQIGLQLQERDKHILEFFHQKICPENKLQYINKNRGKDSMLYKRQNQYRLVFSNANVYNLFTAWGFDNNKSVTATVPEFLKMSSHFWRGCIDGDGTLCITKNRFLTELLGTESVTNSFKEYCHSIGIGLNRNIYFVGKNKYTIPVTAFRLNGKEAIALCKNLYAEGDVYLHRKYEKYLQAIILYS